MPGTGDTVPIRAASTLGAHHAVSVRDSPSAIQSLSTELRKGRAEGLGPAVWETARGLPGSEMGTVLHSSEHWRRPGSVREHRVLALSWS